MPPGRSRFSFFVESPAGLKAYLEINIDDVDTTGPHGAVGDSCAALRAEFERTAAWLAQGGFKRDTSFDRPPSTGWTGGGKGGGRQEAAPPSDLKVPSHCGKPMVYKQEWTNKEDKVIKAKFVCRLDQKCVSVIDAPDPGVKNYPHSVWEDAYRKQLAKADSRPQDGADGAKANGADRSIGFGDFLTAALKEHGLGKTKVLAFCGMDEAALRGVGTEGWLNWLDKMKVAARETEAGQ
jgi:hypothetical protein